MKKISEYAKELGFNVSENSGAQEAFIKYLLRHSTGIAVTTPTEKKEIENNKDKIISFPKQLSFNFFEEQVSSAKNKRKV